MEIRGKRVKPNSIVDRKYDLTHSKNSCTFIPLLLTIRLPDMNLSTRVNRFSYFLAGFVFAILYLSNSVSAQIVVSAGTKMIVKDDTFIVANNDFIIEDGAEIQLSGTLKSTADIECQGTGGGVIGQSGEGIVMLNGPFQQTLTGGIVFSSLFIDKTNNVLVSSGDIAIDDTLKLTDGYVVIGDNNINIDYDAIINGSGIGNQSYIITDGSGECRKTFTDSSPQSFTFPIGRFYGPSVIYSPAEVSITNASSFGRDNYIGARVTDEKYPDANIVDNYLNRYWDLSVSDITGIAYDATFDYAAADVSTAGAGTEADIVCADVSGSPWAIYNSTDATLHRLSASGLSSGGSFTGVDGKVNPPLNRTLTGTNTIPNTTTTCFSAEENLTVGGPGNTFLVEDGGSVELIAGQSITLLPGTHIVAGAFMHAYISTSYCSPLAPPPAPDGGNNSISEPASIILADVNEEQIVKLYPNPTTNNITMEVINPETDGLLHLELFNMNGNRLRKWESNNRREIINLNTYPVGIYLLHVYCGNKSEVARIIKTN